MATIRNLFEKYFDEINFDINFSSENNKLSIENLDDYNDEFESKLSSVIDDLEEEGEYEFLSIQYNKDKKTNLYDVEVQFLYKVDVEDDEPDRDRIKEE